MATYSVKKGKPDGKLIAKQPPRGWAEFLKTATPLRNLPLLISDPRHQSADLR
jgi:hypothetical protein